MTNDDFRGEAPADGRRASTLELFFDLVFVFTLTQLTALLEHDPSLLGASRVVLMFLVLFWMYGGYVYLTNRVPPAATSTRLFLIGGMAAFLVCALAIPHAFEQDSVGFGIGYMLVVLVHGWLYAREYGRSVWRFVPFNLAGSAGPMMRMPSTSRIAPSPIIRAGAI